MPEPTESIYLPGSLSPSARLFEATLAFEAESARADELLQSLIGGELAPAVLGCIQAAQHEIDISDQKTLLRAASFGKTCVLTDCVIAWLHLLARRACSLIA